VPELCRDAYTTVLSILPSVWGKQASGNPTPNHLIKKFIFILLKILLLLLLQKSPVVVISLVCSLLVLAVGALKSLG
jgi:hypothetical protein